MNDTLAIKLEAEPVRSRAFSTIGVAYMGIGTSISKTARMVLIQNLTNANMMFSFDGLNDIFPLPVYGYLLADVTYNKAEPKAFSIEAGARVYVRQINPPTKGTVYITVFYGKE